MEGIRVTTAHCPTCEATVETIDGSCLLGHPVGERSRLDELRAEIEKAFDDASREVAAVLTGEIPAVPSSARTDHNASPVSNRDQQVRIDTPVQRHVRVPTPVPAAPPTTFQSTIPAAGVPTTFQAEPASAQAPPPPPGRLDVAGMWAKANAPGNDDPINAFAPAPRADWGPDAKKGIRRRLEG